MKREHGLTENHILPAATAVGVVVLALLCWFSADLWTAVQEWTGENLLNLVFVNLSALLVLWVLAGTRFDLVGRLREQERYHELTLIACTWMAINAAAVVLR